MSSVKYEGETPNPNLLTNYADNKKITNGRTQPGDMLINNKTNEVIILANYNGGDSLYFINVTAGKFHFNNCNTNMRYTRQETLDRYVKSSDWTYIPVEMIKATNFDIEMK
jgi:hypothetical protein